MKLMRRILVAALVLISGIAWGQSKLYGPWNGQLDVGGQTLTIVLHITEDDCAIDSPDQSAYGIPAEVKELNDVKVSVSIPSIGASYEGTLMMGSLMGNFSQSGLSFPLVLKRGMLEVNRPQLPQPPFSYSSEEVTFCNPADGAVLSGTLCIPEGADSDTPTVLLVSGSGLQDRDESIYEHKPFLVIADHLARNGIASLRYDDRGYGKSTGEAEKATTATFAQDAEAGLAYLRSTGRFGKVGLVGHSEGGLIAFILAGEGKTDFIVSLAGTAVDGRRILSEQVRIILEKQGTPDDQIDTLVEAALRNQTTWVKWFMDFDPAESIRKITCPVMALNGDKDVQVISSTNIPALQTILKPDSRNVIKECPGLNHLFQPCTTGLPTEYRNIETTISETVLEDIATWIKAL